MLTGETEEKGKRDNCFEGIIDPEMLLGRGLWGFLVQSETITCIRSCQPTSEDRAFLTSQGPVPGLRHLPHEEFVSKAHPETVTTVLCDSDISKQSLAPSPS